MMQGRVEGAWAGTGDLLVINSSLVVKDLEPEKQVLEVTGNEELTNICRKNQVL